MFNSLDLRLLNKFQRLADWFQDWFGINNFQIVKILKVILFICLCTKSIFGKLSGMTSSSMFFDFMLIVFFVYFASISISSAEKICKSNPSFESPAVERLHPYRLFAIVFFALFPILIPLIMYGLINDFDIQKEMYYYLHYLFFAFVYFLYCLLLYFGSCTPKKRKLSKVSKFKEKIIEAIKNVKERVSFPNPVLSPAHARN